METAHAFAIDIIGRHIGQRVMPCDHLLNPPQGKLRIGFSHTGFNRIIQAQRGNGLLQTHQLAHTLRIHIREKEGIFYYRLAHARWWYHHARHILRLFFWLNNHCRHDNLG